MQNLEKRLLRLETVQQQDTQAWLQSLSDEELIELAEGGDPAVRAWLMPLSDAELEALRMLPERDIEQRFRQRSI